MARALTPGLEAETLTEVVRPIALLEIETPGPPLRVWSGLGTLSWDGKLWLGCGELGSASAVRETGELQAPGVSFGLSGIDPDGIGQAMDSLRYPHPVRHWIGALDEAGQVVADPYLVFEGRTDIPIISEGPGTATIEVKAESRMIDFKRKRERRYTNADQQGAHPGDRGLEYVAGLQELQIVWGQQG